MSNRWPGGLIRKTPVTPAGPGIAGAAPGVWTLPEALYWQKQQKWPGGSFTVAAGAITYNAAATSVAVPYPAGIQAGDLLYVYGLVQSGATSYIGSITGWTNLAVTGQYRTASYTTATGSETGSVTVNLSGSSPAVHIMVRVRHSSGVTPSILMEVSGSFATNPSLTLAAPGGTYSQIGHLIYYYDNAAINMTSLSADLTQLDYRTTSYGMYSGWIDTTAKKLTGTTITSNSNANTVTAIAGCFYV